MRPAVVQHVHHGQQSIGQSQSKHGLVYHRHLSRNATDLLTAHQ